MDDDCEAEAGWLKALLLPLRQDDAILGVAGAVMVRECGPIGYAESILGFPGGGLRYLHSARGRVVPTRHLSTCNCAYRREAVLRVGGFPEHARLGGEDFLLAERVSGLRPRLCAGGRRLPSTTRAAGRDPPLVHASGRGESVLLEATTARGEFLWYASELLDPAGLLPSCSGSMAPPRRPAAARRPRVLRDDPMAVPIRAGLSDPPAGVVAGPRS
jgi:hypothetical protein